MSRCFLEVEESCEIGFPVKLDAIENPVTVWNPLQTQLRWTIIYMQRTGMSFLTIGTTPPIQMLRITSAMDRLNFQMLGEWSLSASNKPGCYLNKHGIYVSCFAAGFCCLTREPDSVTLVAAFNNSFTCTDNSVTWYYDEENSFQLKLKSLCGFIKFPFQDILCSFIISFGTVFQTWRSQVN